MNRYDINVKIQFFLKMYSVFLLYHHLGRFCNMKIVINGIEKEFKGNKITPQDLVNSLKIKGQRYAIEHNGEIIPRSDFAERNIQDGDMLEIVGAVGGG
tara:strand:+ start:975 stop:1271 length:297 start_codon:yes stop_codon:yes gene_type:complete